MFLSILRAISLTISPSIEKIMHIEHFKVFKKGKSADEIEKRSCRWNTCKINDRSQKVFKL